MLDTEVFDGLEPKQQRAVAELMARPTVRDAASAAGVHESTLYRWLRDPAFADAYRAARSEALQHATARLKALASTFVATLEGVAGDPDAPASSRVAAAKTGLEFAYRADMYEDIQAMIEELKNDE